jgi:hypothetical protein
VKIGEVKPGMIVAYRRDDGTRELYDIVSIVTAAEHSRMVFVKSRRIYCVLARDLEPAAVTP